MKIRSVGKMKSGRCSIKSKSLGKTFPYWQAMSKQDMNDVSKLPVIVLKRNKAEESGDTYYWYECDKGIFIASVGGEEGNIRGRLTDGSIKNFREIGFVAATPHSIVQNPERMKETIKKNYAAMGYNVRLVD